MAGFTNATWRAAVIGRWMALLLGTLTVLFFLAFFFGEGPPRISALTPATRAQFLALGAMLLGLLLAWKWEGMGGFLALIAFAAFVAINSAHLRFALFDVPGAIALLHVLCWLRLRYGPPTGLTPLRISTNAAVISGALFVIFLLLCANEMFGQPPLMTPALRPSADLAGTWTAVAPLDVALTIHEDASVTGTVDGAAIESARIAHGRSWFGKALHWNADYVIRGRIGAREFAAPLLATNGALDGSLCRSGRPERLYLTRP